MKVIIFVCLFALLATSYAVTLKAKSKAVLKALSENLNSRPSYKTVFKNLLTLTDADEYSQVYDILNAVRDEITAALNAAQQRLDDENSGYTTQLNAYEATITDLQSQIDQVQADHDDKVAQRDGVQQVIQDAGAAISTAVSSRDQEVQRRQIASQAAQDNVQAIDEAKAQCDLAIAILQQAADQDLSDDAASFLEVKRKRLHNSLLEVGKKVKKIKINSPSVPFIESLISIAQNTVNQDDFDQIISLIQSLKASLDDERQTVVSDDANDAQSSTSILESLDATVSAQQSVLSTNQDALVTVTSLIDVDESQIESLDTTLGNASDLLNKLDEAHAERVNILQDLVDRLTQDIAAIDQALSFLNSQMS